ncbi:MAG: Fic family protein [bacterium]|nr:Fic family protein [bacterium]
MKYLDYYKLRYKYADRKKAYNDIILQRTSSFVRLPLNAKNGHPLVYSDCSEIKDLLVEIEDAYKKAEVDYTDFVVDEAYATCTIEGAKSTVADTVRLTEGKKPSNRSERMIWNNIRAIQLVLNNDFLFNEQGVLALWKVLSENAIDNIDIQGEKYRCDDVVVADSMGNITFFVPSAERIPGMMTELFCFADTKHEINVMVKAIIIHYFFVYVHPFCDGNGRCARLLLQDYLVKNGLEKFKGVSISTGVLKNKSGYYNALENSENEYNDITFIIIYYLKTIRDVLYQACSGFGYAERHMDMSNRQRMVIAYLRKNKGNLITHEIYAKRYNTDLDTAKVELTELAEAGILAAHHNGRIEYKAN